VVTTALLSKVWGESLAHLRVKFEDTGHIGAVLVM